MSTSPKIVLTTQFTVNQPFGSFLEYMNRQEAKQSKTLETYLEESSEIQTDEMKRYLHYMNREKALIDKQKMSPSDFKELEQLAKENETFRKQLHQMKQASPVHESFQTGLFDLNNDDLSPETLKHYEQCFDAAQKKGNVLFQDVVSFDTKGLVEAGVYNPYINHLNRSPLIEATRKMMQTCYKAEGLSANTISIGAIHYNTEHFHIHVATIEPIQSTRSIHPKTGEQIGHRQDQTIQAMKRTFANTLFKRDEQLQAISQLRNQLREEIKPTLKTRKVAKQIKTLKQCLPQDKMEWSTKKLSPQAKETMYQLIDEVMKDNPNFQTYKELAKAEDQFKREVYGALPQGEKSFYEGRLYGKDGIYYRLSNSVLEELKKEKASQPLKQTSTSSQTSQVKHPFRMTQRCVNRMDYELKQMNRHLSKSLSEEKRKAQYEYERDQQRTQDLELI